MTTKLPQVLLVDEITADRQELSRSLQAEGFEPIETTTAADAVREIWGGSFVVVFISSSLSDGSKELSKQLKQMAPEIEVILYGKSDTPSRLARKAIEIRDGVAAA